MLLFRSPTDGVIEKFTVLQTARPRANLPDADSLEMLLTRYSVINSRTELIRFIRSTALHPRPALLLALQMMMGIGSTSRVSTTAVGRSETAEISPEKSLRRPLLGQAAV